MIANEENIADCVKMEELLNLFTSAYFSRANNLNEKAVAQLHGYFLNTLENDKHRNKISDSLYGKVKDAIEAFNDLMNNPQLIDAIKFKKISSKEFLDKYRNVLVKSGREKYEMSDLYNSGLIATDKRNGMRKKETIVRTDNPKEHVFTDSNNRTVVITDLGQLSYETWNGLESYVSMYKIQQEAKPGEGAYHSNIVYTNISMPNMSDPNYKNLVLDELLSYDNISGAKCGGYIGEIVLQPAKSEADLPHLERQGSYGYVYRLNSKYILHYDPTDVSASMNMPAMELHGKKQYNGRDNNNGGGPKYSKKDAEYER